jgi:competence protein ComEC
VELWYHPSDSSRVKKPDFSHYPLAFLALAFASGIAFSSIFEFELRSLVIIAILFGSLALLASHRAAAYLLLPAFFALGAFCFQIQTQSVPEDRVKRLFEEGTLISGDPIDIEGVLVAAPEPAPGGQFLFLNAESYTYKARNDSATGVVKLFAQGDSEASSQDYRQLDLHYGTRLRIAVRLKREDEYQNPGVVSGTAILDQQNIDAVGTIKSPLMIERLGDERVFLPLAWAYEQRAKLIEAFHETFEPSTAGVLIASLLGDKYFLDKPTADIFREGGTFHVLVISGLHITFIGALALLLVRLFTRKRLWQFLIADAFLWAYTFAVGADVPVVRATVMFTVLSFSYVIYRKGTLLNSFGLCALLLLVWRPSDLFTASFQLTFASVGAIVLAGFPLVEKLRAVGKWAPSSGSPFPPRLPKWLIGFCEMLYWRDRVWNIESSRKIWTGRIFKSPFLPQIQDTWVQKLVAWIFEGALISLIVQIWLLPLLVIYFHRVAPGSIALNLWVGPIIAVESISALIAVILGHVSTVLAVPFIHLTEFSNWLITALPGIAVRSDWIGTRIPNYSGLFRSVYFIYYAPLILISLGSFNWEPSKLGASSIVVKRALYSSAFLLCSAIAIVLLHPFSAPEANGRLTIDFLDVGQGDSALITFPNGETMLVDGGGKASYENRDSNENGEQPFEPDVTTIGENVVSPFLWEKGYSRIDYIVATHADADHIQGLVDVASNFNIRCAYFGRRPTGDHDFIELANVLDKKRIPSKIISAGDRFTIGGVDIDVLFPKADDSPTALSDNNHSVVLKLTYGQRRMLLTGDIEKEAEADLLSDREAVAADVVKVPHHGSRTSSTRSFVTSVNSSMAIISVGRHSMFGHPHPEVVQRWIESGTKMFFTGASGTVTVSTDGSDLVAKTYLGSAANPSKNTDGK